MVGGGRGPGGKEGEEGRAVSASGTTLRACKPPSGPARPSNRDTISSALFERHPRARGGRRGAHAAHVQARGAWPGARPAAARRPGDRHERVRTTIRASPGVVGQAAGGFRALACGLAARARGLASRRAPGGVSGRRATARERGGHGREGERGGRVNAGAHCPPARAGGAATAAARLSSPAPVSQACVHGPAAPPRAARGARQRPAAAGVDLPPPPHTPHPSTPLLSPPHLLIARSRRWHPSAASAAPRAASTAAARASAVLAAHPAAAARAASSARPATSEASATSFSLR